MEYLISKSMEPKHKTNKREMDILRNQLIKINIKQQNVYVIKLVTWFTFVIMITDYIVLVKSIL